MKQLPATIIAVALAAGVLQAQHLRHSKKTDPPRSDLFKRLTLAPAAGPSQTSERAPSLLIDPNLPTYVPRPVEPPRAARYVLRDGSIAIVGYNDMDEIFKNLNALFTRSHPGYKFTMRLNGTATAAPALTHGISAFAPMGAEFTWLELQAYRSVNGHEPVPIRVAHCSLNTRARSAPVAIYINKTNPLASIGSGDTAAPVGILVKKSNPVPKLTVEQVARIFTTGSPGGDITYWGQLGLTGEWARRAIHPFGIQEEAAAGLGNFMLKYKLGGRPFTLAYEAHAQSVDVVKHVGEDPAAIGFASGNLPSPEVKIVAIAENENGYYSAMTAQDIVDGKYPLDRHLLIYVRRVPGESFDPFVKEYLRMVLSREGQQAIAAAAPGYLPLNAREAAAELAKLE